MSTSDEEGTNMQAGRHVGLAAQGVAGVTALLRRSRLLAGLVNDALIEVERLTAERDEALAEIPMLSQRIGVITAERDAAQADADRLARSGWHYYLCPRTRSTATDCTCGWADALTHHAEVAER